MLLFLLQCIFILVLLIPWNGGPASWTSPPACVAYVALLDSIVLAIWTLRHNRPGNFNYLPTPPEGNQLITTGPYQYIRHPMYLALLMAMLAVALLYAAPWRWLVWLALAVTLHLKARLEEKLLCARFAEYPVYKRRTKAILPFLF